jgi:hypothetical protein
MAVADTRPRFSYRLPDGRIVRVIHDHGDEPKQEITYEMGNGCVVVAHLLYATPGPLAERAFARADNDGNGEIK